MSVDFFKHTRNQLIMTLVTQRLLVTWSVNGSMTSCLGSILVINIESTYWPVGVFD